MNGSYYFCYYLESDFSPQGLNFPPWGSLTVGIPCPRKSAELARGVHPHRTPPRPASQPAMASHRPESADISCLNKDKAPRRAFCEPRNVTAEPSLPSVLPRLRPLPRWGSTMAFQLFPEQPPVSLTPLTPLQAALKTDKEPREGIPGSYICSWGLASRLPQGLEEETTGRGQPSPGKPASLGWKSISRGFIWPQELCQA